MENKNIRMPEDWKAHFIFKEDRMALMHSLIATGHIKNAKYLNYSSTATIHYCGKINHAEYMKNVARSTKKVYDISTNLSKDCFLDLMRSSEYQVKSWDVRLKDTNDYNKGFKYCIEGYYLYFREEEIEPKSKIEIPIGSFILFEDNGVMYLKKQYNGYHITREARQDINLRWNWI